MSWTAPSQYTDGSPLPAGELTGFRIYRGTSASNLTVFVEVDSRTTSFSVVALASRKKYFAVTALAAGGGLTSVGTFFGFWLMLGIGLFIEARARDSHTPRLLFLLAGGGNLLGMLFFASPLMVVVFSVFSVILLLYGAIYLAPLVSKSVQLKLFVGTLFCVGGIAVSLVYLFPQNPVSAKLGSVWPVDAYWDALSARNSVRAEAAVTVWQQHPWTGVGADGFYHYVALAVKQEQWGLVEQDRALALSDGTQFLCEYGVFGAGLLLAAVIALLIPLCYRARLLLCG